ncbi:hypothetical protein OEZ86_000805 [Tetradesmus obliquus]|nr:hypothetical protein OEZ86_000805 [Tetradesmus obliquus]
MSVSKPIAATELAKLVASASEAAKAADSGDAAQQGRCLDILKLLAKSYVTAGLLKETDAGKKVNRLSKSADAKVAAAAAAAVQAWKDCVKRQAQEAGSNQPELSSQPSFGTTNSGGGLNGSSQQQQQQQQREQPAASKPSGGSGKASGPARPPPKTGDGKRDKIRLLLCDGLCLVPDEQRGGQDPGEVAAEVEAAIYARFNQHTGPEYGAKVRSLSFNFKDPSNPDLRARVLQGQIDPQELVDMSPEELASDEKRKENDKIRQEAAAEAVRGQSQQASTDMFKCARCKQNKCTYYQMQTRSADEPMTTFVTCVNCQNKWKFC